MKPVCRVAALVLFAAGNGAVEAQDGRRSRRPAALAAARLVPDHASAHHFLVHTYETAGLAERALEHGEAYARQSPAIPHAAHMWGHDLRRVGRIDEAITQFMGHALAGQALIGIGDLEGARRELEALAARP
jgi:hypothetical protein